MLVAMFEAHWIRRGDLSICRMGEGNSVSVLRKTWIRKGTERVMSASETLQPPPPNADRVRKVFFFDIDNTCYRKSTGIDGLLRKYIRNYIESRLNLTPEDAEHLQETYYKNYGLAVEGLVRKNHINAMEYNQEVDDAMPLETRLRPDKRLHAMLSRVDRRKWKLWLCTNAHKTHGLRVVKLLGIEQFFEGITYCNYERVPMICKPMPQFFESCMDDVLVEHKEHSQPRPQCYFVDDSVINCNAAEEFGWIAYHVEEPENAVEPDEPEDTKLLPPLHPGGPKQIQFLCQLPQVCPELFE